MLRAARVDPATGPTPEVGMIASRLSATDQGATVWAAAQTVGSPSIRQDLSTAVSGRLARFRYRWRGRSRQLSLTVGRSGGTGRLSIWLYAAIEGRGGCPQAELLGGAVSER